MINTGNYRTLHMDWVLYNFGNVLGSLLNMQPIQTEICAAYPDSFAY